MTTKTTWGIVKWLHAVCASDIPATDRLVLLVLPKWIGWDTLELWPSVQAIAGAARLTTRTVGAALDRLAARGVLEFLKRSRGGRSGGRGLTHHLRVHPEALAPNYSEGDSEYSKPNNPEGDASLPPPARPDTPKPVPEYPEAASQEPSIQKPSIHPTREPSREPSTPATEVRALGGGCMDAPSEPVPDLRTTLTRAGIRGENLTRLADAAGLTVEAVERERRAVEADGSVRNPAAVLARRLADVAGVVLKASRRLDPQARSAITEIEKLRRRMGPPTDPAQMRRSAGDGPIRNSGTCNTRSR